MTRTAVFDLDGTLADTAPDLIGALNGLLEAEGLPTTTIANAIERHLVGRGGKALIKRGFEAAGKVLTDEEVDARFAPYLDFYEQRITRDSRLFPGVLEALDTLEASGWILAVCTNKPEKLAHKFLDEIGVASRFAAVLGADTLPVRKPDPRHLLETIERAGGTADRAVLIGDTETDRLAGRNANVPVVLVSFGYWPTPVSELAAEAEIDSFDALAPILEQMIPRV